MRHDDRRARWTFVKGLGPGDYGLVPLGVQNARSQEARGEHAGRWRPRSLRGLPAPGPGYLYTSTLHRCRLDLDAGGALIFPPSTSSPAPLHSFFFGFRGLASWCTIPKAWFGVWSVGSGRQAF